MPVDVDEIPAGPDLRGYIREHVLTHFRPQVAPAPSQQPRQDFWFVRDPALHRRLTMDWREAQAVFQVQGWKSCLILCGGILEAILLDVLGREGDAPAGAAALDLPDLIEAARARGLLGTGIPPLGPALRAFQTLIHPGLRSGEPLEVTREEAHGAMTTIRMCLRQIAASRGD